MSKPDKKQSALEQFKQFFQGVDWEWDDGSAFYPEPLLAQLAVELARAESVSPHKMGKRQPQSGTLCLVWPHDEDFPFLAWWISPAITIPRYGQWHKRTGRDTPALTCHPGDVYVDVGQLESEGEL